jgi:ankyrin repeat protein
MVVAVRKKQGTSADQLWSAIETGDASQFEKFLASGPAINFMDKDGVTPLMYAACYNRVEVVKTLIERGADVNAVRADGFTPLLLAIFFGHIDVVRVLVENGADVTATTRFGTSAHMWAAARGFREISAYLQKEHKSRVSIASVEVPVATSVGVNPVESANKLPEQIAEHHEGRDPVIVRRLKDPPEIWDLVHENRTSFNPGATFVSHILSIQPRTVALTAIILAAMISVPTVIKWKAQARSAAVKPVVLSVTSSANEATQSAPINSVPQSSTEASTSTSADNNSVATAESSGSSPVNSGSQGIEFVGAHSRVSSVRRVTRSTKPKDSESGQTATNTSSGREETGVSRQTTQATPAVESNPNTSTRLLRDPAAVNKPSVVNTNSHLLDRPSGSPTTKPKVIQWP